MTDYVIRREGEGAHLVVNGLPFRGHSFQIQRGLGEPTRIVFGGRTIELQPGDTLQYEGWDEGVKSPALIGSDAEFDAEPTRLQHVIVGQHLERLDLRHLAYDLYRLERGGAWEGDVPTAHRVNIAVDWWNGDAREAESG